MATDESDVEIDLSKQYYTAPPLASNRPPAEAPIGRHGGEDIAVTKFREYLRINTEQPKPDYAACTKFLSSLAGELNIPCRVVETAPGTPFVIMTIPGARPELKSLMLYSHTDVVPTFKESWKHDPYSAHKDANGDIYARGAQDMKCVGSQYFEALRRHIIRGKTQWTRTIHIVWGPDEEIGGPNGMKKFVEMPEFKELNIGFICDEGLASETNKYKVYYAERCPWWLKVTCKGSPGHGSKFIENTAGEKMQSVISNALAYREEQKMKLKYNPSLTLGDVTTLNLTIVEGGVQVNVLPEQFVLYFDIRIPPTENFDVMQSRITQWCEAAGPGVTHEFLQKNMTKDVTPHTTSDPWWAAFEGALKDEQCQFTKEIFTGATDSRFLRALGYPAIGFSPMIDTPVLLHDHNEKLNEKVFLRGVKIYETLIDRLASTKH